MQTILEVEGPCNLALHKSHNSGVFLSDIDSLREQLRKEFRDEFAQDLLVLRQADHKIGEFVSNLSQVTDVLVSETQSFKKQEIVLASQMEKFQQDLLTEVDGLKAAIARTHHDCLSFLRDQLDLSCGVTDRRGMHGADDVFFDMPAGSVCSSACGRPDDGARCPEQEEGEELLPGVSCGLRRSMESFENPSAITHHGELGESIDGLAPDRLVNDMKAQPQDDRILMSNSKQHRSDFEEVGDCEELARLTCVVMSPELTRQAEVLRSELSSVRDHLTTLSSELADEVEVREFQGEIQARTIEGQREEWMEEVRALRAFQAHGLFHEEPFPRGASRALRAFPQLILDTKAEHQQELITKEDISMQSKVLVELAAIKQELSGQSETHQRLRDECSSSFSKQQSEVASSQIQFQEAHSSLRDDQHEGFRAMTSTWKDELSTLAKSVALQGEIHEFSILAKSRTLQGEIHDRLAEDAVSKDETRQEFVTCEEFSKKLDLLSLAEEKHESIVRDMCDLSGKNSLELNELWQQIIESTSLNAQGATVTLEAEHIVADLIRQAGVAHEMVAQTRAECSSSVMEQQAAVSSLMSQLEETCTSGSEECHQVALKEMNAWRSMHNIVREECSAHSASLEASSASSVLCSQFAEEARICQEKSDLLCSDVRSSQQELVRDCEELKAQFSGLTQQLAVEMDALHQQDAARFQEATSYREELTSEVVARNEAAQVACGELLSQIAGAQYSDLVDFCKGELMSELAGEARGRQRHAEQVEEALDSLRRDFVSESPKQGDRKGRVGKRIREVLGETLKYDCGASGQFDEKALEAVKTLFDNFKEVRQENDWHECV